jgi:magnesium chelatase subunit H
MLETVDVAYQNLESVELGVTTIDHYFDTLGGINRAVKRARGGRSVPVYIGDQTRGDGKVRTLCRSRSRWKPAPARSTRNGTKAC